MLISAREAIRKRVGATCLAEGTHEGTHDGGETQTQTPPTTRRPTVDIYRTRRGGGQCGAAHSAVEGSAARNARGLSHNRVLPQTGAQGAGETSHRPRAESAEAAGCGCGMRSGRGDGPAAWAGRRFAPCACVGHAPTGMPWGCHGAKHGDGTEVRCTGAVRGSVCTGGDVI